jgi:hypothetical protein
VTKILIFPENSSSNVLKILVFPENKSSGGPEILIARKKDIHPPGEQLIDPAKYTH